MKSKTVAVLFSFCLLLLTNARAHAVEESGCDRTTPLSLADRITVIEKLVAACDEEVLKTSDRIIPIEIRDRIGTFSAGLMADDVPFVSLDRSCWADFYEAEKSLLRKDESGAAQHAAEWRICMKATFPDRLSIAKPYFSCFVKKSDKPSDPEQR